MRRRRGRHYRHRGRRREGNAAAFAAQQQGLGCLGAGYQNNTLPGADGIYGTADDTGTTFAGPDGVLGVNPLPAQ